MKLKRIQYAQGEGTPREWSIEGFDLQEINLLVGRNATGKSRVLNVINGLAAMLSGRRAGMPITGHYQTLFDLAEEQWSYHLRYEDSKVAMEELRNVSSDTVFMSRGAGGSGTIKLNQSGAMIPFSPPENQLAIVARQDALQHPFFEPFIAWGHATFHYAFGTTLGHDAIAVFNESSPPSDPHEPRQVIGLLRQADKEFGDRFKSDVIRDMGEVGYTINDLGLKLPESIVVQGLPEPRYLFVQEDELLGPTEQNDMSQGMFRALAIIIMLNYGWYSGKANCILIDDIGEGLDYERSTALIKLIIGKARTSNSQLIMSTNDRFVMNAVPLDYWQVLHRNRSVVRAFSKQNAPERFERFKFTGLSNFDFFSKGFLDSEQLASDA